MEKEIELIPFLERVMKRTTKHYQEDFSGDCARLKYAAENPSEERIFYWMARPCGTWLVRERDAFLKGTFDHAAWTHYGNIPEGIQAYRVVVTGIDGDMPVGTVLKLNYPEQVKRVEARALRAAKVEITFMSGERREIPAEQYKNEREWLYSKYGMAQNVRYCPEDEAELARVLAVEYCCQKKPQAKSVKKAPQHGGR